jgi:amidase
MIDVEELTIATVHSAFQAGTLTCRDLTAAYLDRIARFDKSGPKLGSTWALSATALDEAAALDDLLASTGKFKGRLHGIPILVKDQADTAGMTTTYGSATCKSNIPTSDAFLVEKLKHEGAVVLGKTSMPDWASSWFAVSSVVDFAFTHNPYKLGHDPGASSGGSGAAVAANLCMLAVGEDTGGSVRCPASFNNIVGLRCTVGLISRSGFCPLLKPQDTPGPMARTVDDCARMMDCMVGFDRDDEYTALAMQADSRGYSQGLDAAAITRARVGVVRQLFGPESDPACAAVNAVVNSALAKLAAAGTTVHDIAIPHLEEQVEFGSMYNQRSRADISAFLATKPHLPSSDLADLVPAPHPHPAFDFTSQIAHGPKDPADDSTYLARILARDALQRRMVGIMAEQGLDALVFPDVRVPPPRHEDATNGRFPTCWDFPINTLVASSSRLPAVSVPAGFTGDGLPVGLELMSWEFRERALLEMAKGVETLVGARRAPRLEDL